ncbi:MAG: hypothetical protein GIX03_07630 [Candidatus Eremiobacteraeota bacterium]|nr:hypothetical protein [Candidatus Eremiobacteraeota bacterium]
MLKPLAPAFGVILIALAVGGARAGAGVVAEANATEPISGLPIAPSFMNLADKVQSYTFCGKSARSVSYIGGESSDPDRENVSYAKAIPNARVFTAMGGIKTFITPNGTTAVETAGDRISFFRFTPGLSPAQMKILGAAPGARACSPN